MDSEILLTFAMQNAVSGAVLYYLKAFPEQIARANANLLATETAFRFVQVDPSAHPRC